MRPLLLLLQLLCLSLLVHPQTKTQRAQVDWGPDLSMDKDGAFDEVFGNTSDHVYLTVFMKKELFVQKMDNRNKRIYHKVLPMKVDRQDHEMERILLFGDRILVFTRHFNKSVKTNDLYLRMFSEADMKPIGKAVVIGSIDVEKNRRKGSFEVRISPDEKALAVIQQFPFEKGASERFKLAVYDEQMLLVWERIVTMPYLDSEFEVTSTRVANDGSVMVVGRKFAEDREARELQKEMLATHEYHLVTYDADGGEPEDHALLVPEKFLHDLTLDLGEEGDILAGGFYGLKGTNSVHGVFFLRLDRRTKAIVHSNFKEFERDFITAYMTEKEEKKVTRQADKKGEELEMYNYELRDIVRRDDGGAVIVGEQYRMYTTTSCMTTQNGGQTCTTIYNYVYNDIIVVNVEPQGTVEWAARVPKRQHTTNDRGYYSSFALAVNKDKIFLMFNDSGKNLFLTPGQKVEPMKLNGKESLITLATIDQDGRVYREALMANDRRDAITRPRSCVQLQDDRMFIFAKRRKDHRFGTMTFL
jgi:hypothetical protein